VKVFDANGYSRLSWIVCGIDWVTAQRDPRDPSRPLFEAANMSLRDDGTDDRACGALNRDAEHAAICRSVASGVTYAVAAGNDATTASRWIPASYNEVITVSALADTDGKPGALGGHRCWSWGSYDSDDTFANFSNYGYDVDLIAPGKCIWSTLPGNRYGYMSGTSMAAPHVTAAAAMYKSTRPWATPSQVKLGLQSIGNLKWRTSTDPDNTHEKLLDVSRLSTFGDFEFDMGSATGTGEAGGTTRVSVRIDRSSTHFDPVRLTATMPSGWSATFSPQTLAGFSALTSTMTVRIPLGTRNGSYPVTIAATDGPHRYQTTVDVDVTQNDPTAHAPVVSIATASGLGLSPARAPVRLRWTAATDPTSPIGRYETQLSIDGGAFGSTAAVGATTTTVRSVPIGQTYRFRIRAMDIAGNWSPWVNGTSGKVTSFDDRSATVRFSTGWRRWSNSLAYRGTETYAGHRGPSMRARVSGKLIAIVARVGPTRGWARVYVNGDYKGTVSLYARSSGSRRVVWSVRYATAATRTVSVAAAGTSARPRVDIDAVLSGS
jgi:hypothetical protein